MNKSVVRLILLSVFMLILIGVSGSIYVNAQSGVDQGPVGQSSGTTSDQTDATSGVQAGGAVDNSCSALDPNTSVAVVGAVTPNNADITAAHPEVVPPSWVMNFIRYDGAAFRPRNSTYTYAESGSGGCIYATANPSGIWNVDLQLPSDAIVDIVRMFWYDTSASDSYIWLTEYDDHGAFTDIGSITSSGTAGYGDSAFYPSDYVIDTYNHSLLLNWRPIQQGATMMLCGVRVRYWTPGPAIALPFVHK
jgi:hypothetical protein